MPCLFIVRQRSGKGASHSTHSVVVGTVSSLAASLGVGEAARARLDRAMASVGAPTGDVAELIARRDAFLALA